jgi:TPR repeat protein
MLRKNDFLKHLILLRNDPELAAHVLHEARSGNVDAQYAMGMIFAEGRGVPLDLVKAFAWLTVAVLQGDRDAVTLRNIVGAQMSDEEFEAGKRCAADYEASLRQLPATKPPRGWN